MFFHNQDNVIKEYQSKFLHENLRRSKITSIKELEDGLFGFVPILVLLPTILQLDTGSIFYPNMAFSNVILDKEKNYWLTTLHDGLIRVADINSKTWNTSVLTI